MSIIYTPTKVFFTKGVGKHKDELKAEQLALRSAGLEDFIYRELDDSGTFPIGCKQLDRDEGFKLLQSGNIIDCILIKDKTDEPNRLISASIGLAIPSSNGSKKHCGYILGYSKHGMKEDQIGDYVEDNAATMLAMRLGIDFNPDTAWDERENLYKVSGKILKAQHYTQTAIGDKDGLWTSIVVAAVYLP